MYQLWFYVPEKSKEVVKDALFAVGAGKIGNYSNCCWETEGIGQFLPQEGSSPTIGNRGTLQRLREYRVELVVADEGIGEAVSALKESHPYEEPAYGALKIET